MNHCSQSRFFQFSSIRKQLIEEKVNVHVRNNSNNSQYELYLKEEYQKLSETSKSVHFSIVKEKFPCLCEQSTNQPCPNVLTAPWFYETGVFNRFLTKDDNGKLIEIGRGGQGVVLEGQWCNIVAAVKFVRIKQEKETKAHTHEVIADLNDQINEMTAMNKIKGKHFVKMYGHYRLIRILKHFMNKFLDNNCITMMIPY